MRCVHTILISMLDFYLSLSYPQVCRLLCELASSQYAELYLYKFGESFVSEVLKQPAKITVSYQSDGAGFEWHLRCITL
jgi:hypothetical protein